MKTQATASAPARANLLGEHTDYNDGYVLPTPLSYRTTVRLEIANDDALHIQSENYSDPVIFNKGDGKTGDWPDYIVGCVKILNDRGIETPGLRISIESDIPSGMGISSSAALTVGTLRALRDLLGHNHNDFEIARCAHEVEKNYVGVPCGIMDQMVSATGEQGKALFLDTLSLKRRQIDLPAGYKFCIVHSGLKHQLKEGDSGYKQRVAECQAACRALGVKSLRDINDPEAGKDLPDPISRRVRHVVSENARVIAGAAALEKGDAETFGRLMVESHNSQRDDYEVSIPKIDQIVKLSLQSGALGARLTGGGFGGAVVSLVRADEIERWWAALSSQCEGIRLL